MTLPSAVGVTLKNVITFGGAVHIPDRFGIRYGLGAKEKGGRVGRKGEPPSQTTRHKTTTDKPPTCEKKKLYQHIQDLQYENIRLCVAGGAALGGILHLLKHKTTGICRN